MAKKKSLWQSIKNWFTGGSSKSNSTSTNKSVTKGSGYSATSDSVKQAYLERERKKKEQEEAQKQAYEELKAKQEQERLARQEQAKKQLQQKYEAQAKATQKPQQEASAKAKNAILIKPASNAQQMVNSKNGVYNQQQAKKAIKAFKSYSDTVKSEANKMNVAPQVAQKLGTDKIRAKSIEASYALAPTETYLTSKYLGGRTMGVADLIEKNAKGETKKALDKAYGDLNKTQKTLGDVAEIYGNIKSFGQANTAMEGVLPKLANKVSSGASEKAISKLAESGIVKKMAENASKTAVKKGLGEITAEAFSKELYKRMTNALGGDLTAGMVQSLVTAAETEGDNGDKARAFLKDMGINLGIGAGVEALTAGKGVLRAIGSDQAKEAVKSSERKAASNLLKPMTKAEAEAQAKQSAKEEGSKIIDEILKSEDALNTAKSTPDNLMPQSNDIKNLLPKSEKTTADVMQAQEDAKLGNRLRKALGIDADSVSKATTDTVEQEAPVAKDELAELLEEKNTQSTLKAKDISINKEKGKTKYKEIDGQKVLKEEISKADGTSDIGEYTPATRAQVENARNLYNKRRIEADKNGYTTKLSRVVETDTRASSSEGRREIINGAAKSGRLDYNIQGNKEGIKNAVDRLFASPKTLLNKTTDYANNIVDINMSDVLDSTYDFYAVLEYAGKQVDNAISTNNLKQKAQWSMMYEDALVALKKINSVNGQIMQLRGAMVRSIPEVRDRSAIKDGVELIAKSAQWRKMMAKQGTTVTKENAKKVAEEFIRNNEALKPALEELWNAKTEKAVGEAYTNFIKELGKSVPAGVIDYLTEWRYLSMLGSFKTHARNFIGNTLFGTVRELSNSIGYGLESALRAMGKIDAEQMRVKGNFSLEAMAEARTKKPTTEAGIKALETWNSIKDELMYGDPKYEAMLLSNKDSRIGITKPIGKLAEWNSNLLELSDQKAMEKRFRENYIKLYKANKVGEAGQIVKDTDSLLNDIAAASVQEAKVATFREFNEMANWLSKQTRGMWDADASLGTKAKGIAINAVMPFQKTPANILKQSINYSPVGLAKSGYDIAQAIKTGNPQKINMAIESVSSGLTGSAIMALGFGLGKETNLFNTKPGKNDYAGKYKKGLGVQNYSVRIGDQTITLDWLSPTATTFFMGVDLANAIKNSDSDLDTYGLIDNFANVASTVIAPVWEMSMMSGLKQIVEDAGNEQSQSQTDAIWNIGRGIVWNYIGSFIPTLQGQVARTLYDSDKQILGDNDIEYQANLIKNKLGLAQFDVLGQKLGAKTDMHGNVVNDTDEIGLGTKFLRNAIFPWNTADYKVTEGDEELVDTYNKALKEGVDVSDARSIFPTVNYNRDLSVGKKASGKEQLRLSNLDLAEYNKAKKYAGKELVTAAVKSKVFDSLTNTEKKALIDSAPTNGQEALTMLTQTDAFQNADTSTRQAMLKEMWTGSGKSKGYKKAGEMAAWESQGKDKVDYLFKNELSAERQNRYNESYSKSVSKDKLVQFSEGAVSNKGSYTVEAMYSFLNSTNWTEEEKAACFNTFKSPKTKAYSSAKASQYGVGNDPWADVDGSTSSGSSSSSSSSSSSDKSKAPKMNTTKKGTYADWGKAIKKAKKTPELKSNYTSKIKPPDMKW